MMQYTINHNGYKIIIARNYGNTTINAYSATPPVQHFTADTIDEIKKLIDREQN
jgi:hypothetical protein